MIVAQLFGPPSITIDGSPPPAELLWRKHLALCLILWGSDGRRRSRDQLIGMLWPDKDERAARHSLNEGLRVIRKVAGEQAIESDGQNVAWVGALDLDVDRFASVEREDATAAAALAIGPYCDGFVVPGADGCEQWLDAERRRWQPRLVKVLVAAAARAADGGELATALTLTDRAVRIDPHSEVAARAAITTRWLHGDRGGAVAYGQAFAARLESELGLALDPSTAELLQRVARESRPRVAEGNQEARRGPLCGREHQLARLLEQLRAAMTESHPALLIITGGPGTGRSRLLEEVSSRALVDGATLVTMRALDADSSEAHAVLLGLAQGGLDRAPGLAAAPPGALATLAAHLTRWAERFPSVTGLTGLPVRDAVAAVIRATAEERPLVLAVDDAQRLDDRSLHDIPVLLRSSEGLPVIVVLVFDREERTAVDELRRAAGRDFGGATMRVEPLDLEALGRLVEWGLPAWAPEARARLARRLFAESDGAPGIAVELLAAVIHGLELREPGATWPAPDRTLDQTLPAPMPEPLVAAIRIAFGRLPEGARQLLTTAALLAEPFTAARLGDALDGMPTAAVEGHLDLLEWERWLVVDGRGYSFAARAVRRLLAEEMLTPGQRRRLEERLSRRG
jgi:DNA-binding SARP family transcriptional activator